MPAKSGPTGKKQVALLTAVAVCIAFGLVPFFRTTSNPLNELVVAPPPWKLQKKKSSLETKSLHDRKNASPVEAARNSSANILPAAVYHYTPPSFEAPARHGKEFQTKPLPVTVLEQYIQWHSVDSLRRDPHHRKFAVAFYSCPLQAGNRMHHFFNGVLWSILTNRTVLWKYWDTDTCLRYRVQTPEEICHEANTASDCASALARAPWIPSYDEWHAQLRGSWPDEPTAVPFHSTHPRVFHKKTDHYPWGPGNDETTWGVDVKNQHPLVYFPELILKYQYLTNRTVAHTLLHSDWSRAICQQLFSQGVDFLYGMLFRYTFEATELMKASIPSVSFQLQNVSQYYTIALHSRHAEVWMDGCDIAREQRCLKKRLWPIMKRQRLQCVVFLMADRTCTIDNLSRWAMDTLHCQVMVASHDAEIDWLLEHGPFAGTGFYQDLALVTLARSAFVGYFRSSSDLVLELITFYRKMEAWRDGMENVSAVHPDVCLMGSGRVPPPKGYVSPPAKQLPAAA